MSFLSELIHNGVLGATLVAWILAQTIKVILAARREHRFDFRWFLGTGGMPSAHSAGVSALGIGTGLVAGFHSAVFTVALMFALVTMFDAQGVRRATGRQAIVLNKILDELYVRGQVSEERLRELLGHTPIEVIMGALVGCSVAVAWCG